MADERPATESELKAYYDGLREGIMLYAHWKDGTQYVGTTGRTLIKALEEVGRDEYDAVSRLTK